MKIYDWYPIIKKSDFEATGLVQRELEIVMPGIGSKKVLVTKANAFGIVVDDVFLAVGVTADNPFEFEDRACYIDPVTDWVWYGVYVSG